MRKHHPSPAASQDSPAYDPRQAPINGKLGPDEKIQLYRDMVRIRRFEERCLRSYQQGRIGGFLHLYTGQESVVVGANSVLSRHDHMITAYRDHGHALAVGMGMNELMAELYGKYTGCSKGKGGSMHFFDPTRNYWGGHGIVGGQVPLGTGLAFAIKYKGIKGASLTFMGDGAVNQGTVHEACNIAALWSLPVVFIIENNGYSMGTSQERSSAGGSLARRAAAYAMAWDVAENGHDVYEVRDKVDRALRRAHDESLPTVLEIDTYRYRGHSVSDPDTTYRDKKEIEEYKRTKDPIMVFQNALIAEGVLSDAQIRTIDEAARREAETSANYAEQSPYPTVEDIKKDVYWEEDNPQDKKSQGRIFFDE
ncbi:MAG: pyruvate dehydrogenase (acetyl-transferring) E1 component subunit alpha [Opitutaceae bacterium]|nr:pyruvate dehydrogenase (acetyl-transferring) E1 component subunit alpha [Opitutaceae bacterium]